MSGIVSQPTLAGRRLAEPLNLAAHVFVLTTFALALAWIFHYLGGASHRLESAKYFNLHPLFNSIAFVLALGEAVLVYRTLPVDHPTQKVTHGVLQAIVFAFGVAAVVCVNRWKTHNGFDHWYSVHSWIGLVLLSLVGLQWLVSFLVLLSPGAAFDLRKRFVPVHRFTGLAILSLAFMALLTGVLNQQRILPIHESAAAYGNVLGVFLMITFLLLLYNIYPRDHTAYDPEVGSVQAPDTFGSANVVSGGSAGDFQQTYKTTTTETTAAAATV